MASLNSFLPLSVEGVNYYIFNVLSVINDSYINKDKAVSAPDIYDGLTNILFDGVKAENLTVFKSNIDHRLFTFCSDKFKQLVEDNGLYGLVFEELKVV